VDIVTVDNMFNGEGYGIESISFDDGTSLAHAQIPATLTTGTAGNDSLVVGFDADLYDGKGAILRKARAEPTRSCLIVAMVN
jgi:hypothetical protein